MFFDWQPNPAVKLANTFFYFSGNGYYDQLRKGKYVEEYFPGFNVIEVNDTTLAPRDYYDTDSAGYFELTADSLYAIKKVDLVRHRQVIERDWGWLPKLTLQHNRGNLTVGGEMRIHSAHHFGEVRWAGVYPAGVAPDNRYYDYRGGTSTFTLYAYESYHPAARLTLTANLQYQRHNYKLDNDKRFRVTFNRNYDFFSPRTGINYKISPAINIFANVSIASRQPAFKDIYDPTDYWSNPDYKPGNFTDRGQSYIYKGKELKPEKLYDFELGTEFTKKASEYTAEGGINLYRMQIKDEIVPYAGQLDDNNYPISGNAPKTIHQGVEFSGKAKIKNELSFGLNLSINDDHFVDYREYGFDWDGWQPLEYDRSNKRIGGFPAMLANYYINYSIKGVEFGVSGRYVGKQYIDNGEQYELPSYHVQSGQLAYDFGWLLNAGSLKAVLRINNLTNTEYSQAAYIEEDDGQPRYIVGAERNFYISITAGF